MEPGLFRDCDTLLRNLQGRLEILAVSVHAEGDTSVDHYDDHEDVASLPPKESADVLKLSEKVEKQSADVLKLSEKVEKQSLSSGNGNAEREVKQNKCSTCNAYVGDANQYRDHFKSDWHKHNLKRKTRQLPPLTAEECLADMDLQDSKADLKEYSF